MATLAQVIVLVLIAQILALPGFADDTVKSASESATNGTTPGDGLDDPSTLAQDAGNETNGNSPLVNAVELKTANPLYIHPFTALTIFKDGNLTGKWKSCGQDGVQFANCVKFPTFVDRLSLLYTFDTNHAQEYVFSPPSIKARTGGAKPSIENFDHSGDKLEFTIFFNCVRKEKPGNSTEVFDLQIPILQDFNIETRFTKTCGSGRHPYIHLGMKNGSKELEITPETNAIQIGPNLHSTEFFIRIVKPAESIVHREPQLKIDGGDAGAKLRGLSQATDIVRGRDSSWWLTYDCDKNEDSNIVVTIPIPPWDDLKVQVAKRCRGNAPVMLNIGTAFGFSDVVKNGVPTAAYNMTHAVGHNYNATRVIGKEKDSMRLYISNKNTGSEGDMHLGKLHITESNTSIARVHLLFFDGKELGVVKPTVGRMDVVRFVCLREGNLIVVFSLPVLHFRVVEFCVIKKCAEPKPVTRLGWRSVFTAEGVEDLFFFIAGVLSIAYCVQMRRKHRGGDRIRGQQYEQVATG